MADKHHASNLPRRAFYAALYFLVFVSLACSKSEESRLKELVPGLPGDIIRHVMAGDDSALAQYARDVGLEALEDVYFRLGDGYQLDSMERFQYSIAILQPLRRRLARIMASEFANDRHELALQNRADNDPEHELAVLRLWQEQQEFFNDTKLTAEEKIEKFDRLVKTYEELGEPGYVIHCKSRTANLYSDIGNTEEQKKYLRSAITDCREIGYNLMACQLLGVLGSVYENLDQADSMRACYDEAMRLAERHQLWKQYARLTSFYAAHYKKQGRLSIAHDFYQQAQEVCRHNNLGNSELRFVRNLIDFHAELGAWDIVGRLLHRAHVLYPKRIRMQDEFDLKAEVINRQMEARYLMALGKVDSAVAVFKKIRPQARDLPWRIQYPQLLYYWADGLIDNGRPDRALPIIDEGLENCAGKFLPVLNARLLLLEAKAFWQLGDTGKAARTLEQFDEMAQEHTMELWRELVDRDVLNIEILLHAGDEPSALAALQESLGNFLRAAEDLDEGVFGYLSVARNRELRRIMHDLLAAEPSLGYGAELCWLDIYRALGAHPGHNPGREDDKAGTPADASAAVEHSGGSEAEWLRGYARAAEKLVVERGAVHCTYAILGEQIRRWTCSRQGIRCDTLAVPAKDLAKLAAGAWEMMAKDPGDREALPGTELTATLRELAVLLLPAEIPQSISGRGHGLFFVTCDGFLAQLPFETLDIAAGEKYCPLLHACDVAYIRHADGLLTDDSIGPGVVLINANSRPRAHRRYPAAAELTGVEEESRTAMALHPGSLLLKEDQATKPNLMEAWEDASFIYIASHMFRSPQAPYLSYIPLHARDGFTGPESHLDIEDIRRADLRKCKVVILSGCASGTPYIDQETTAPGFGDAFLDAGAAMVIQTFWDVIDEDATSTMSLFVELWGRKNSSMIESLCDVKRSIMTGDNGVRHPFNWAAYSIKAGRM